MESSTRAKAGQTELCSSRDRLHLQEIAVDKTELNMCSSDSGSPGRSSYQADMCFDKPQLCPLSHSSGSCRLPPASSLSRAGPPAQTQPQFCICSWSPLGGCARAGRIQPDRALHGEPSGKGCGANISPAACSTPG